MNAYQINIGDKMTKLQIVYQPKGRAREYAELAANLYMTCIHGCKYCYSPKTMHKNPDDFFKPAKPKEKIIQKITSDARQLKAKDDQREILLSFTSDIYQPQTGNIHPIQHTTRAALTALLEAGLNITVLTKGGSRSMADIDLFEQYRGQARYGVTLTYAWDSESKTYEPLAAPTSERIATLKEFHVRGIRTWVSIEPAWSIEDTMSIIHRTHKYTDMFAIGKLNYHPHEKEVDWYRYTKFTVEKLQSVGVPFYIKKDLRKDFHNQILLKNELLTMGPQ